MAVLNERIKDFKVLKGLEVPCLELIAQNITEVKYKKSSFIFLEGELGEYFYFIFSGIVKLSKLSNDGQEKIILIIKENDIMGEVALFDNGNYPTSAEVIEDCQVGRIKCDELRAIINKHPNIAVNFLHTISTRLRQAQRQIRNLALKDAYGRLACRLFKLSRDHGEVKEEGIQINLNLSNQEIAKLIGTSRETVSRILNEFKRKKIIDLDQQQITILNMDKLKTWM